MKLILRLTIALYLLINSCELISQNICFSNSSQLNQLELDFKNELKSYYKLEGKLQGGHYKKYLEGITNQTIPRDFFTNTQKLKKAMSLKESSSFKLVWNKFSEIEDQANKGADFIEIEPSRTASKHPPKERKDFYAIDPNSDVFNCLIENIVDDEAKRLFKEIQRIVGLSPGIIAHSLLELNNFEEPAIRTYIGLQFYYDFIFMMNGVNKIE